jgi:hypothetical protein
VASPAASRVVYLGALPQGKPSHHAAVDAPDRYAPTRRRARCGARSRAPVADGLTVMRPRREAGLVVRDLAPPFCAKLLTIENSIDGIILSLS